MAWWYDQKLGILLLCLLALSLTVSLSLSVTKVLVERLCNCRVYHTGTDYRQDYRELTIFCESGQTIASSSVDRLTILLQQGWCRGVGGAESRRGGGEGVDRLKDSSQLGLAVRSTHKGSSAGKASHKHKNNDLSRLR